MSLILSSFNYQCTQLARDFLCPPVSCYLALRCDTKSGLSHSTNVLQGYTCILKFGASSIFSWKNILSLVGEMRETVRFPCSVICA